jgi:hypothetical protein
VDERKAEIIRRALLALVTALLVARPLVLGEDPGLLDLLSGTSGLILSMLWLIAAAAWAVWRAWFKQNTPLFGGVELGLAAVTAVIFLSSLVAAHYQRPALLIAWEWLILVLAFCLIRQLARRPEDVRGLLAVLVASGVSLSVHAIYQFAVELPRHWALANNPQKLLEELAKIDVYLAPDDPHLEFYKKRFAMPFVYATFAHANAFAGYLALLFPIALGWALAARRLIRDVRVYFAFACALLIAVALGLTQSRGAILGTLLAGSGALAVYYWRAWWRWKVWLLAGFAVLGVLCFAASRTSVGAKAVGKATESFALRNDYWRATWNMIADHPWLGVGPGNFGRHYTRYMLPSAFETIRDPHNFALELWSTSGVFAMLALLATLGVFFHRVSGEWLVVSRGVASGKKPQGETHPTTGRSLLTTHHSPLATRWDLYIGGMAGLLLGFLLRAGDLSLDVLPTEAVLSGVRSIVWLAVFALLEGIPWTGPSRTLALVAGVTALLLNLCISGGIAWPSVAQPLWAVAALALLSTPQSALHYPSRRYSVLSRALPLPILAGVAVVYLLLVFWPVTRSVSYQAEAWGHYGNDPGLAGWRNVMAPRWRAQMAEAGFDKGKATRDADLYLTRNILSPLLFAVREDPSDSKPPIELARWYLEEWGLFAALEQNQLAAESIKRAVASAKRAQLIDRDNKEAFAREYEVYRQLAERYPGRATEFLKNALAPLKKWVDLHPTEAALQYQLAATLMQVDNHVDARQHAAKALELDRLATSEDRHLTAAQRAQAEKWLKE